MADNNYSEDKKMSQFLYRTNALANESNALKLKVDKQYCEKLYLVGDFVVSGGGAQLEFTASGATAAYDFRYINVTVIDQSGNEAGSTASGTSAVVTVDTSALNPQDFWTINVIMSTEQDISIGCECFASYQILVNDPSSDPTVNVNEVTEAQRQVIAVFRADGTTPIADGGAAYNIGSFAAGGTTEPFSFVIKNTGENVLKITTPLVVAPDVLTAVVAQFDEYVYPGQSITVTGTVDSSGGAGAKTGSVTITSDDPSNASYVVNIAFTLT